MELIANGSAPKHILKSFSVYDLEPSGDGTRRELKLPLAEV